VLPYLDLDQSRGLPGGVAVLIPRVIRRGLLICGCQLDMARKRGRTDACVLYGDPPGAAYRRPRRRCCCPRRLVRPRLFGKDPKRVAFTWRSPAAGKDTASPGSRTGPPTKSTPPAGFTRWRGSPCAAARPRRPPTSNRTSMSVSGSAITSSSVWNLTITKITRRTGMIRMIVPANNTRHQLK